MPTTANKLRLLTPGPTQVPEAVLRELAQPIIHHRTDEFRSIFAQVSDLLKHIFCTEHPVLSISGSGTTAFESAQISLVKPDSKVITVASGKFGERWQDVYDVYSHSFDIRQVKINVPWGDTVRPEQLDEALRKNPDVSVVVVVHSETSTATACDLQEIAKVVHAFPDALLIVDSVTAVGALPLEMDAWGIDVAVTSSQKALMLPPGLGFVALGQRAQSRLDEIEPSAYFYLDLRKWLESWRNHEVPFTPPVNLLRGQRVALQMIECEGLRNVWSRTASLAKATRTAFEAMGLKLISAGPSDSVTGAFYPPNVDDAKFRAALRDNHGISIAGGQDGRGGKWKGKIFRISHMGYVNAVDTLDALGAIEVELRALGYRVAEGTATDAACQVLER